MGQHIVLRPWSALSRANLAAAQAQAAAFDFDCDLFELFCCELVIQSRTSFSFLF